MRNMRNNRPSPTLTLDPFGRRLSRNLSALCAIMALAGGCGWFGGGTPPKEASNSKPEAAQPSEAGSSQAAEPTSPADDKKADKKLTQAELEELMAPPDGLMDLRPIIGTDPADPLPALFAKANKGMSPKALNALFVGVGNYRVQSLTLTTINGGKSWYRVKGNQPHREILGVSYDDKMGLEELSYMTDAKKSSLELWEYFKKAAGLKWGTPKLGDFAADSDYMKWAPEGLKEIELSGGLEGDHVALLTVRL